LHDDKRALADWNQSLAVKPYKHRGPHPTSGTDILREARSCAFCYQNRSFYYFTQGRYKEGVEDLTKAIEIRPGYAPNFKNRAIAYKKMGKFDLAKKDNDKADKLKFADPERAEDFIPTFK